MNPNFAGIPGICNFNQQNIVPNSNQFADGNNIPYLGPVLPTSADFVRFDAQPPVSAGASEDSLVPSWDVNTDEPSLLYLPTAMVGFATDSSFEENDFSEIVKHITQILMEENTEERPSMLYDPLNLQVTEKSFYDALGGTLSPEQRPLVYFGYEVESPDGNVSGTTDSSDISNGTSNTSTGNSSDPSNSGTSSSTDPPLPANAYDNTTFVSDTPLLGGLSSQSNSQRSTRKVNLPRSTNANVIGVLHSSANELLVQNIFSDKESVLQFNKGLEEASKFLPKIAELTTGLDSNSMDSSLSGQTKVREKVATGKVGLPKGLKGREKVFLEEGRSRKQSAIYLAEAELSELFDKILLDTGPPICVGNEGIKDGSCKTRPKKQPRNKGTVDLTNLLLLCAQAVSGNDDRTAYELLKQIRKHASPLGDGSQRVAHFFANGLEARLAGSGMGVQLHFTSLASTRISPIHILKAYKLHVSSCPFVKFSISFANKMIMKALELRDSLHIIDFGMLNGFQWPILIKYLSNRPGGPPKLRITGIELPLPGFHPKERLKETGNRLAKYCKRFNVPFEFNDIALQRWETIQIEELKIDSRELLAVNCLFRFTNLLDETVETKCPRNAVLSLIRKMNPDIFVQNIVNGAYNAPFFFSRFKEALFHFSALFDIFDTIVTRENENRLMFEREIYALSAMNVIACEGLERVERPETYKQWQARLTRCGFRQLPLDYKLIGTFRDKLNEWYHRDFVIYEDCNWMLQGWKGRILYASSCWVPA